MTRIPEAREVSQALRALGQAARRSLDALNQLAGQRMAKGDYEGAETLAAKGREIRDFAAEVEALGKRWRAIRGAASRGGGNQATPLWTYYQPILRALIEAGGEATRADLEPRVEAQMREALLPGDCIQMARGQQRWQVMLRRARKHLVQEGWIEDGRARPWRVTDAGRKAAKGTAASTREAGGRG